MNEASDRLQRRSRMPPSQLPHQTYFLAYPERSPPLDETPYLTHITHHYGRMTLIPPVNAGRMRKAKSKASISASTMESSKSKGKHSDGQKRSTGRLMTMSDRPSAENGQAEGDLSPVRPTNVNTPASQTISPLTRARLAIAESSPSKRKHAGSKRTQRVSPTSSSGHSSVESEAEHRSGEHEPSEGPSPPSPTLEAYLDALSSPSASRSVSQDTVTPDTFYTANSTRVDLALPEQQQHIASSIKTRTPRSRSPLTRSPPISPSFSGRENNSDSDSSLEIIDLRASHTLWEDDRQQGLALPERIAREGRRQQVTEKVPSSPGSSIHSRLGRSPPSAPSIRAVSPSKVKPSHIGGLLRRPSFLRLKSPEQGSSTLSPSPSLFNILIPTRPATPVMTPYLVTPTSPSGSTVLNPTSAHNSPTKPEGFLTRTFTKGKQKQHTSSLDQETMDTWELVDSTPTSPLELGDEIPLYGHPSWAASSLSMARLSSKAPLARSQQSSAASSQLSLVSKRRAPPPPPLPSSPSSRVLASPSSASFTLPAIGPQYTPPTPDKDEKKRKPPPPPPPPRRRTRPSEKSGNLTIALPSAASTSPPSAQLRPRQQPLLERTEDRMSAPPPRYMSYAEPASPLTPTSAASTSSTDYYTVSPTTPTFDRGDPPAQSASQRQEWAARSYSQSNAASVNGTGSSKQPLPSQVIQPSTSTTYMYTGDGQLWNVTPAPIQPTVTADGKYWGTLPPGAASAAPFLHYPVYATMPPGCAFVSSMPAPHWHAHAHASPSAFHAPILPPPSPYGLQTCASLTPCAGNALTPMMAPVPLMAPIPLAAPVPFATPPRPSSPSASSIRSNRSYASRPLPTPPTPPPGMATAPMDSKLQSALAAGSCGIPDAMRTAQAPVISNAMFSAASNPHRVRSVLSPEAPAAGPPETDLDVLLANMDIDAQDGTNYEALTLVSEIIGPATPPPTRQRGASQSSGPMRPTRAPRMLSADSTASSSSSRTVRSDSSVHTTTSSETPRGAPAILAGEGMPFVGQVEIERRRVTKDGRTKLKLMLLGVRVDKCGICLSQFKEGERAALGPTCQHGFHDRCLRSWLSRSRTCPMCRASFGAQSAP